MIGLLIFLTVTLVVVMSIMCFVEFCGMLDGKTENIIKDGLIIELLNKATADPDPDSLIITDNAIYIGRITIEPASANLFWFPYIVKKSALDYGERRTTDDWGYTIGYVFRFSKDYIRIKALLKKDKVNIEKEQKQKLGL